MNRRSLLALLFVVVCQSIGLAQAPTPRDELLSLVPADAGFCFIVQNLRDQSDKWRRSPWVKALKASPIGQALAAAPELKRIAALEKEMQKHLQIDWPSLRDDVFGDAVVLAYWPGPPGKPEQQQGILLVRARSAKVLGQLIDRLNEEQTKSGEIKELTTLEHQGTKYYRRKDARSTHYLLVKENLLVFASKEPLLQSVIEARKSGKPGEKSVIAQQVARAGAERAFSVLWINPRAFEPELNQKAQMDVPEAPFLRSFLAYWRPLEAIVLSVSDADEVEVRFAVQAQTKKLPASIRKAFDEPSQPAELWNRFPPDAILTTAGQIDVGQLAQSIGEFLTPQSRKEALESLQKSVGAAVGLNLVKDVLPQIGPDWGLSIAAGEPKQVPHILAALAVKSGSSKVPVDRALRDGVRAGLTPLMLFHNAANPDKPLHIKTIMQKNVEVNYLAGEQVFPPGLQPAWALKDGYLVFASSPEAMLRFHVQNNSRPSPISSAPIIKLSTTELARLIRENRQQVVDHLAEKNKIPNVDAGARLELALGVMDLIDHITLAQASGDGQIVWIVRMRPRLR